MVGFHGKTKDCNVYLADRRGVADSSHFFPLVPGAF